MNLYKEIQFIGGRLVDIAVKTRTFLKNVDKS